jgi:hypothetical protein
MKTNGMELGDAFRDTGRATDVGHRGWWRRRETNSNLFENEALLHNWPVVMGAGTMALGTPCLSPSIPYLYLAP